MSDSDQPHEALERLEHIDRAAIERPGFSRRTFLRRTALTGVASGLVLAPNTYTRLPTLSSRNTNRELIGQPFWGPNCSPGSREARKSSRRSSA